MFQRPFLTLLLLATLHSVSLAQTAVVPSREPARNTVSATAPKTVAELRARIQEITRQPQLAPALFAVKIISLDTNRVLYEENAAKLVKPASNMKIYPVAAALDRLTPEFRFKTSVYAAAQADASGTVRGDLTIYGRGDPSIAASFNDGNYFSGIDALASRIVAAGVKRVEGDLVGDETYFSGAPFGPGWEWDDLQWEYGAEVSALTINDNTLDLFVKAGGSVGAPCVITLGPPTSLLTIVNHTATSPRGTKRDLAVYRDPGENTVTIGGSLPLEDPGFTSNLAISHPARLFMTMLRQSLEKNGVRITGRTRVLEARAGRAAFTPNNNAALNPKVEIASLQSPPLRVIAARTLKESQNLYAELILRSLGKTITTVDVYRDSTEAGVQALQAFLTEAGIDATKLRIADGSGLSRENLITAEATAQLLVYMDRHRYASAFRDALPIAGVGGTLRKDGTLRNRMKNTPAAGNVRAKTGTLDNVGSLSGYVTSAAGERFAFSLIINNDLDGLARREYLDNIAVLLASFTGRS